MMKGLRLALIVLVAAVFVISVAGSDAWAGKDTRRVCFQLASGNTVTGQAQATLGSETYSFTYGSGATCLYFHKNNAVEGATGKIWVPKLVDGGNTVSSQFIYFMTGANKVKKTQVPGANAGGAAVVCNVMVTDTKGFKLEMDMEDCN